MKISLQEQLKQAIANANNWEVKYWDTREKLDKYERDEKDVFNRRIDKYERVSQELIDINRQMMEIVRWHVNPETAKEKPPEVDNFNNRILR